VRWTLRDWDRIAGRVYRLMPQDRSATAVTAPDLGPAQAAATRVERRQVASPDEVETASVPAASNPVGVPTPAKDATMRTPAPPFFLLTLVVVAACGSTPGASPTPSPFPTPGAAFTLDVFPVEEPPEIRIAIPGSRYCFLVVVTEAGTGSAGGSVVIDATATKAEVVGIQPVDLDPGVVGEVCVEAAPASVETSGTVTITGSRDGVTATAVRTLPVFPMADERAADARPHFDRWVAWLAAEHPELGITTETAWEPVFVSTLLVVSHYSYWSADWEITIAWHNMIAPHDWSEVHLRRRGVDSAPTMAFRIDSVSGATNPHEVAPPEAVVR
jgi:hypothetical protein